MKKTTRSNRSRARRGFSLIEIMIVIAIIALLGGIVGFALFARYDEAQENVARVQMNTISDALKDFRRRFNRYPTDDEGLAVLWSSAGLENPEDEDSWSPSLEEPIAEDPWGNEWGYRQQSENGNEDTFDLWSVGKDGEEGTEDDITSWSNAAGGQGGDDFDFDPGLGPN